MKEEIKEIINNQKLINVENDYERIIFEYLANNCSEFDDEHIKQLVNLKVEQYKQSLDYITNLQKSQETLIKNDNKIITNLQEENEKLKEQVNENKVIVEYAIKPSFTKRKLKDYKMFGVLKEKFLHLYEENKRLNNIINRMEEDLKEMYMTFGEFSEEYTEKQIRELKEGK